MRDVTLLAPAGSRFMLRKVSERGPDAIFLGALGLSRRWGDRYEFTHEGIKEAANITRDKNIKLYVVMNRTEFPQDIEDENFDYIINSKIPDYLNWGIDTVILGNFGLMKKTREKYQTGLKIIASVGCNIMDRYGLENARIKGADVVVPCSALKKDEIINFRKVADTYQLGTELLVQGTNCIGGVGGCDLYKLFPQALIEEEYKDTDGFITKGIIGDPEKKGGCYRPCQFLDELVDNKMVDPKKVKKYIGKKSVNFNHAEHIPGFIENGITHFKIQGREYNPYLIAEIVGTYRLIIDKSNHRKPKDIKGELKYLNELNREIEKQRLKNSDELKEKLLLYLN